MADAVARREARRRRILENSQNRLQFISSINDNDCPKEFPIRTIPEQVYEIPVLSESSTSCMSNGVLIGETETLEILLQSRDVVAAGDGEVASDLAFFTASASVASPAPEAASAPPSVAPFTSPTPEPAQTSIWEKLTSYRYDIVLLSLLIQFLYGMSLVTFNTTYFFLPLTIHIMTKLIWFPMQNNSIISNVLLLLNSSAPARVHMFLYITQSLSVIFQDVCVFLFITICVQSLWIVLKDSLVI